MMLQNILINLNILSKIKPYDKIYISKDNLITIEYNSIFKGFFRFIYNNGREKNITNFFKEAFEKIKILKPNIKDSTIQSYLMNIKKK